MPGLVLKREKARARVPQSNDFHLHEAQETMAELVQGLEFSVAMEKAVAAIREVQP
jgi:hypothetical protein